MFFSFSTKLIKQKQETSSHSCPVFTASLQRHSSDPPHEAPAAGHQLWQQHSRRRWQRRRHWIQLGEPRAGQEPVGGLRSALPAGLWVTPHASTLSEAASVRLLPGRPNWQLFWKDQEVTLKSGPFSSFAPNRKPKHFRISEDVQRD